MATEDRTPPVIGVLGFSMETTLALLPRMYMEELQSELERRSIEVKLAGVDRPRGRDDLEHVLREVMTREYEEAEGDEGMDMSDTSSTFEPGCSNTSSAFEHGSWLLQVGSSKPILINDQATSQNVQKLSQPTEKEGTCSRQPADMHVHVNVSQAPPSTGLVQVKKEPINRDFEQYSNSVARMTEPSTSQTNHPDACIGEGSQPNSASSQDLMVRIKTEPGMEEETEDEQQDKRREPCPSSPRELSQELDMVTVCKEEEEVGPSNEEPVKGKRTRCVPIRPEEQLPAVEADRHSEGAQSDSITQRSHRFATLNGQQLDELEDGRVEKTTERATKWGVNLFKGAEVLVHPDPAPKLPFACSICEKTFKTKKGLRLHEQGYHNNKYPFRCDVCGTGVFSRTRLLEHYNKHLKKGLYECKVCNKASLTASGLQYHKELHKTAPTPHKCSLCDKTFCIKKNMLEHLKTHTARFECNACDKIYKSRKSLVKHHKDTHNESASKDFVCTVCSKTFRTKQYLSQHLVHHSTVRKFVCELCGKKFKTKQHMQVHQGSKNCKPRQADNDEESIWRTSENTI